ncbi:hypothetical protein F0562_013148 [Nyssa sinensis]|uniref:Uncharacterized protein n=1 Tax=Nyssa sinensis TaxID=561372 RepID=A0A5J4ZZH5_9ASTE|nr:hypothetical protein F0562_013148 [Nyssa sinensis]
MEERLPSPTNGSHDTTLLPQNQTQTQSISPPRTSQSAFRPGTYVVQVPKDQIYRVPPPEHALLAERHRKPPRQRRSCCTCFFGIFAIVAAIAIILGLIGGTTSIFLRHNSPTFHIEHVLVKNPTLPPDQQHHSEYDITLKSNNPNDNARISYNHGGDATLSFRQQEIAVGTYPTFDQGPKNSTVFRVKIGALKIGTAKIAVTCNLTVDSLAKVTHVLSQECHTKE